MKLTIEKPIPVTPTPVPVSTPVGAAIEPQTVSGTYNASWLTGYMPACDAIFDGMVPDNTTLDVEFSEGVAVLDLGDGSLSLTADQDWYANYAPAVDGIQVAVMLFANSNDDGWLLSWTATSDDKVCLTSATLTLP